MHSPTAIVEPLLGHFEVVVGQIAPKESLNSAFGRGVVIVFKGLSRLRNHDLQTRQNPSVSRREIRPFFALYCTEKRLTEPSHIPQLVYETGTGPGSSPR